MLNAALEIVQSKYPDVVSISDGTKNIAIEVTPDEAKAGKPLDHHNCPYAIACKRALNLRGAIIMRSVAYLVQGTHATRYIIPNSVNRELVSLDRGAYFAPGVYRLNRPWAGNTLKSKAKQKPQKTKRRGSGRKKAVPNSYVKGIRVIL